MQIVQGSGNRRQVFDFPCAEIVKRSSVAQQVQAKALLCTMLNIPPTTDTNISHAAPTAS